jgi:hypothetical protein
MSQLLKSMQPQNLQSISVSNSDNNMTAVSALSGSSKLKISSQSKSGSELQFVINTNIINTLPPKPRKLLAPKERSDRYKKFPKSFSLRNQVLPATSQELCGSCWAYATANVFSDIINLKYNTNINLSVTDLLRCNTFNQDGCGGGHPSSAMVYMQRNGIVTDNCLDYSWCRRNAACSGNAVNHFKTPPGYLNTRIPRCGGCYAKDKKIQRYFPKNLFSIFAENKYQAEAVQYDVREHIQLHGPVVGCFFVLSNFKISNGFPETNGVYLESFNYVSPKGETGARNSGKISENQTRFGYVGGHAVTVVGWGEQMIDTINPDTRRPYGLVKYWITRNSWGDSWGDGGYWKMAMYPHNKFSQFDLAFNVSKDPREPTFAGGFQLMEIDFAREEDVLDTTKLTTDELDTMEIGKSLTTIDEKRLQYNPTDSSNDNIYLGKEANSNGNRDDADIEAPNTNKVRESDEKILNQKKNSGIDSDRDSNIKIALAIVLFILIGFYLIRKGYITFE